MQLLDFYKARFGTAVKRQGNGWNGPCPLCGGEPGKSDRFVVWPERSESLGETCASKGINGIWACRQCGASGDTIAYLMKVDGLDFKAALAELGIEGGRPVYRQRRAPSEPRSSSAWEPRQWSLPTLTWSDYAAKLQAEAEERIWQQDQALHWLATRGIDAQAVRAYRIGYLSAEGSKYPGRWRARAALGLEPRTGDDGKVREKIFIPRGIVIPTIAADGRVMNLRIRRHREDLREHSPKYLELEGSCRAPLLLRSSGQPALAAYFVTEAELDAMLIHHSSGGVVGALAVRTNRGKPDASAHRLLRECVRVCIALDYDDAGAEGVDFWEKTYASALRWPTPEGKDPGDAFRLGVDMREWIAAALPASIALPKSTDLHGDSLSCPATSEQVQEQNGQMDPLPSGQMNWGGGAAPENSGKPSKEKNRRKRTSSVGRPDIKRASKGYFTPQEYEAIVAALPSYLSFTDIYLDACSVWLEWRSVPVTFVKLWGTDGRCTGFEWCVDEDWRGRFPQRYTDFQRCVHQFWSVHHWLLSLHSDSEITADNFFHIWG
ncbi:MAG: hypothetical protein IJD16_09185 [Desulfovibrio sp.]|nr:hypothetical protein [Desulfovibrio sp.]